jgi:hypothetical protein
MGGNELKYIQDAFDTNWISQYGSNIDEFERGLENALGDNSFVTALSSGTAAIHLALRLLDVEEGDFVICQSFTFVASVNPVLYQKAIPILVDSETSTWNMCPNALEDAIKYCLKQGKKPKAIIAVSLYGMPFMVDEIKEVSKRYEFPLLKTVQKHWGVNIRIKHVELLEIFLSLVLMEIRSLPLQVEVLISHHQKYKDQAVYFATQQRKIKIITVIQK